MKRFLLAALFLLPAPAFAQVSTDEICSAAGDIAESVMWQRQQNLPMSELMKRINEVLTMEDFRKLGRLFVKLAYQEPAELVEEDQLRVTAEFRNSREINCYAMMED